MNTAHAVKRKLESISRELEERGEADLAREVGEVIDALRQQTTAVEPSGGVLTTGEAAALLGVRSINTVKRWARDGLLEGFRRGGRIVVSRRSVERMLRGPQVAEQGAFESAVAEALEPFMAEQEEPSLLPWIGRKPWPEDADAAR